MLQIKPDFHETLRYNRLDRALEILGPYQKAFNITRKQIACLWLHTHMRAINKLNSCDKTAIMEAVKGVK